MTSGALAPDGPAPSPGLFGGLPLPPCVPGHSNDWVQCRYELHRALDFGAEAERAEWCERWGEALVERALGRRDDSVVGVQEPISTRPAIRERMPSKKRRKT